MIPSNPWNPYRQIATQTAPPGQLVLMLFDGALSALDRALEGFANANIRERNETIHNNLRKATDIIRHLNHSLNTEAGGKLAQTLRRLYNYFDVRLSESNMRKQRDGVDEVVVHLKELRDAWAEMLLNRAQSNHSQELEVAAV